MEEENMNGERGRHGNRLYENEEEHGVTDDGAFVSRVA